MFLKIVASIWVFREQKILTNFQKILFISKPKLRILWKIIFGFIFWQHYPTNFLTGKYGVEVHVKPKIPPNSFALAGFQICSINFRKFVISHTKNAFLRMKTNKNMAWIFGKIFLNGAQNRELILSSVKKFLIIKTESK